ncbi:MAG: hypothetical protein ACKV0T_07420 [Planctomycetales bacterium]
MFPIDGSCVPLTPHGAVTFQTFMLEIVREALGVCGLSAASRTAPSKIARELHARIAAVLERRTPRTSELVYRIARHAYAAGTAYASGSVEHCLAAARTARKKHACGAARRYIEMAEQSASAVHKAVDVSQERLLVDADEARLAGSSGDDSPAHP